VGAFVKLEHDMSYSVYDFLGNVGVFLIIISYLLLQLNKLESKDIKYSAMNFLGASLVIVSLIENFNMSALVIEVFWVGISIFGIVKYFYKK
jgi:hypothetical protein